MGFLSKLAPFLGGGFAGGEGGMGSMLGGLAFGGGDNAAGMFAGGLLPGMVGMLNHKKQQQQSQIDPSLLALGQTQNGQMPTMTQAPNDAAAAAYGGAAAPVDWEKLGGMGGQMMAASRPQFNRPAPPEFNNPWRFTPRGRGY